MNGKQNRKFVAFRSVPIQNEHFFFMKNSGHFQFQMIKLKIDRNVFEFELELVELVDDCCVVLCCVFFFNFNFRLSPGNLLRSIYSLCQCTRRRFGLFGLLYTILFFLWDFSVWIFLSAMVHWIRSARLFVVMCVCVWFYAFAAEGNMLQSNHKTLKWIKLVVGQPNQTHTHISKYKKTDLPIRFIVIARQDLQDPKIHIFPSVHTTVL